MAKKSLKRTIRSFYRYSRYYHKPVNPFKGHILWTKVVSRLMELVSESVLEGYIYKIPYGMGTLRIRKYKTTRHKKRRDYNEERKYFAEHGKWIKIYHKNWHSSGFEFKLYWNNSNKKVTNKLVYTPSLSRYNARKLAKLIKDDNYQHKFFE
jgi:hypothetical protein